MPAVSVVVPVYNSETSLEELVARLDAVLKQEKLAAEVILVNDASRDGSWDKMQGLCERYAYVQGVNMMRNYGQHNALLCGIRLARNEVIVTIDDDLQHPPEEIPRLMAELEKGYDVVYGTPAAEDHGFLRDLASKVTKLALQNAMGAATARRVSAFRVFRTQLRDAFAQYQGSFVSIDVLLTWGSTRFSSVPVKHVERPYGVSNYTFRKLLIHAMNMMTGFSVLPLQLASLMGFAMTFLGLVVLALRVYPVCDLRRKGAGIFVSGVADFDFLGGADVRHGDHGRVPGADALPESGAADLYGSGARGGGRGESSNRQGGGGRGRRG